MGEDLSSEEGNLGHEEGVGTSVVVEEGGGMLSWEEGCSL